MMSVVLPLIELLAELIQELPITNKSPALLILR